MALVVLLVLGLVDKFDKKFVFQMLWNDGVVFLVFIYFRKIWKMLVEGIQPNLDGGLMLLVIAELKRGTLFLGGSFVPASGSWRTWAGLRRGFELVWRGSSWRGPSGATANSNVWTRKLLKNQYKCFSGRDGGPCRISTKGNLRKLEWGHRSRPGTFCPSKPETETTKTTSISRDR